MEQKLEQKQVICQNMKELESAVESHLRIETEKRGGMCVKFIPDFKRGFPDRIVMLPGGVIAWVETKRPEGGRVSPAQRVAHELLRRLGQQVYIVWTKADGDALLRDLDKRKTPVE